MEDLLSDEAWEWIESRARRVRFDAGTRLAVEGDDTDHVYAIRSGRVKAVAVTTAGEELLLAVRGPDQTVGELAALDPGPREASLVAWGEVEAWVLTRDQYLRMLTEIPGAAVAQLRVVVSRLRESIRDAIDRGEDLTSRISGRLLALMDESGSPELAILQKELAAWVGATREGTVRCLRDLRSAGAIATDRGRITVLDRDVLARFR